ncbi:amidase family protein [Nocardia sp. NPDC051990]|uniref:amidase family protein n=1 Tax=Nocardia sp. NPDC051990 TaxID=3155285 RepID=UPI00342A1C83
MFDTVDLVLTPTVTRPAPRVEASGAYTATLFVGESFSYHTAYWNALGNPALSMPIGFDSDGLPSAAQLIGRPFDEAAVLRAADSYQRHTDWHLATPQLREGVTNRDWEDSVVQGAPADETQGFIHETLRRSGYNVPAGELAGLAAGPPQLRHRPCAG